MARRCWIPVTAKTGMGSALPFRCMGGRGSKVTFQVKPVPSILLCVPAGPTSTSPGAAPGRSDGRPGSRRPPGPRMIGGSCLHKLPRAHSIAVPRRSAPRRHPPVRRADMAQIESTATLTARRGSSSWLDARPKGNIQVAALITDGDFQQVALRPQGSRLWTAQITRLSRLPCPRVVVVVNAAETQKDRHGRAQLGQELSHAGPAGAVPRAGCTQGRACSSFI